MSHPLSQGTVTMGSETEPFKTRPPGWQCRLVQSRRAKSCRAKRLSETAMHRVTICDARMRSAALRRGVAQMQSERRAEQRRPRESCSRARGCALKATSPSQRARLRCFQRSRFTAIREDRSLVRCARLQGRAVERAVDVDRGPPRAFAVRICAARSCAARFSRRTS